MTARDQTLPEAIHQDALALTSKKKNTKSQVALAAALKNRTVPRLALPTKEAAAAVGLSVRSLMRAEARGLVKSCRLLRTKLWPVSELQALLDQTTF